MVISGKLTLFQKVYLIVFFLVICVPIFPKITGGMLYHVLVLSLIPLFFLLFVKRIYFNSGMLFATGWVAIHLLMSIWAIFLSNDFSYSGVVSIFKYAYFYLYIFFSFVAISQGDYILKPLLKIYLFSFLYSVFIFLTDMLFPELNALLYKREEMDILVGKATGLFNTTYHYAFFLLPILIYATLSLKNSTSLLHRMSFVGLALASYLMILASQSRMFFIVASLYLLIIVIFNSYRVMKSYLTLVILGVFGLVSFYIMSVYGDDILDILGYVYYGIMYIFSGGLDFSGGGAGSFNTRINQILFSLEAISQNPLFGAGTGKDIYLETVYANVIYKFGIPGLFAFSIMTLSMLVLSYKISRKSKTTLKVNVFKTIFWMFFLSPLYMLSGPVYEVQKLSFIYFGFIGLILGNINGNVIVFELGASQRVENPNVNE